MTPNATALLSFRLTIRNVNQHPNCRCYYEIKGFRLTIRNVNLRTAVNIAAGIESFRLTIRNVNGTFFLYISNIYIVLD